MCGLWSLIRLTAFIHLRKPHNWIQQCQFFNNNHTQLLSIEPETCISKGFKLKWHMVPWRLQMSTLLWKVSKFCRLFFIVNQLRNVFLSHAKCPFLWTSKQTYDVLGNGGLEVENILFDQKVLRAWSIKMKRVSENFPLTAHINTLSVPLDTHFSKLKISK